MKKSQTIIGKYRNADEENESVFRVIEGEITCCFVWCDINCLILNLKGWQVLVDKFDV